MSFLAPLALLFGLLAVPILILYMLRLRRPEQPVSSTLLWRKLTRDREANAPWQKLRRNLLLFLQLLILALLVMALARPFLRVPRLVNQSVVILLDGSASMQATDVLPSRFEVAKEEINRLIGGLGSNQMTIIQAGRVPEVLAAATTDRRALYDAVAAARPGNSTADWAAAFALAAGAAQGFSEARVIILSDGGLPAGLPPLPAETVYVPVGNSGENMAIAALATRETEGGVELFARVTNEGVIPRRALLTLEVDGRLFDAREVSVDGGLTDEFTWALDPETAVVVARLGDHDEDHLALDDTAVAVHEGGVRNRALLITEGNIFLEQVFAVLPGVDAFKAPPDSPLLSGEGEETFDLYVFDGVDLPLPLPAADLLIINPRPDDRPEAPLRVTGTVTGTQQTAAVRLAGSPLLQFVDWSGVNIRQMQQVDASWAEPLVSATSGPLLLVGEQGGHRLAVLTFDLQESDLPLKITFPILMANLLSWLSPGRAFDTPDNLAPGEIVTLVPNATADRVEILRPDDTVWAAEFSGENLLYDQTDQLGLYEVALGDAAGLQPAGRFAINLFAPEESAISPAASVTVGAQPLQTGTEDEVGQWELWSWLVVPALLVLLVEWWVYHRGARLPTLPRTLNLESVFARRRGR